MKQLRSLVTASQPVAMTTVITNQLDNITDSLTIIQDRINSAEAEDDMRVGNHDNVVMTAGCSVDKLDDRIGELETRVLIAITGCLISSVGCCILLLLR